MEEKKKLKKISDEVWQAIPFTDKPYEISNYGRVRSFCISSSGQILKPTRVGNFLVVSLRVSGKVKRFCVHKLTAEIFVPKETKTQSVVTHKDWNFKNNHFQNLQWLTPKEAYSRMHKRNNAIQRQRGIISNSSKLKPADVVLLKSMLNRGVPQRTVAKLFAISEMQVTRIKRGENWGNVGEAVKKFKK